MTVETWKEEFYGNIDEAIETNGKAVLHALNKYKGAKKENLDKHSVNLTGCVIKNKEDDGNRFVFNVATCALCELYFDDNCFNCPLFLANDEVSCCDSHSYYDIFEGTNDPKLMIKALKNAKKYIENNK